MEINVELSLADLLDLMSWLKAEKNQVPLRAQKLKAKRGRKPKAQDSCPDEPLNGDAVTKKRKKSKSETRNKLESSE